MQERCHNYLHDVVHSERGPLAKAKPQVGVLSLTAAETVAGDDPKELTMQTIA